MTVALEPVLVLVHVGVAAGWLGAMAYSLLVVQPRAERYAGDDYEQFAAVLAAGARWPVVAMMAALALSGAGLVVVADQALWVVVVKSALLAVSVALFWYVSWRLWPRRLFALPSELPAIRRRFRLVAYGLLATVGLSFVLGVLSAHWS
jgi:hypothetical protein